MYARRTATIHKPTPPVLFEMIEGQWVATQKTSTNPESANHLIVCDYGDWSGFRTLAECMEQIPNWQNRRPGFYRIVQR